MSEYELIRCFNCGEKYPRDAVHHCSRNEQSPKTPVTTGKGKKLKANETMSGQERLPKPTWVEIFKLRREVEALEARIAASSASVTTETGVASPEKDLIKDIRTAFSLQAKDDLTDSQTLDAIYNAFSTYCEAGDGD